MDGWIERQSRCHDFLSPLAPVPRTFEAKYSVLTGYHSPALDQIGAQFNHIEHKGTACGQPAARMQCNIRHVHWGTFQLSIAC